MVGLASGNPVLSALVEALTTSTNADEALGQTIGRVPDFAESAELHRQVYNPIRSRNPVQARLAMQRLLEFSRAVRTAGTPEVPSESAAVPPAEREGMHLNLNHPAMQREYMPLRPVA
jgi:DNA-binding FadR family transcriptional regulator